MDLENENHKTHRCVDEITGSIQQILERIRKLWSEKKLECGFVKVQVSEEISNVSLLDLEQAAEEILEALEEIVCEKSFFGW